MPNSIKACGRTGRSIITGCVSLYARFLLHHRPDDLSWRRHDHKWHVSNSGLAGVVKLHDGSDFRVKHDMSVSVTCRLYVKLNSRWDGLAEKGKTWPVWFKSMVEKLECGLRKNCNTLIWRIFNVTMNEILSPVFMSKHKRNINTNVTKFKQLFFFHIHFVSNLNIQMFDLVITISVQCPNCLEHLSSRCPIISKLENTGQGSRISNIR